MSGLKHLWRMRWGVRYRMVMWCTFLVSAFLFIADGVLAGSVMTIVASAAFLIGVVMGIVLIEREREEDNHHHREVREPDRLVSWHVRVDREPSQSR